MKVVQNVSLSDLVNEKSRLREKVAELQARETAQSKEIEELKAALTVASDLLYKERTKNAYLIQNYNEAKHDVKVLHERLAASEKKLGFVKCCARSGEEFTDDEIESAAR